VLSDGITVYFKHCIAEHHIFFPGKMLPKHHFLSLAAMYSGCNLHSWCMRYESKHHLFFKRNFINITKTLAKKHQSEMAYNWQTYRYIGPGKMVPLKVTEGAHEIANALWVPSSTKVLSVKWAKQ
jgi:hypothetical protein